MKKSTFVFLFSLAGALLLIFILLPLLSTLLNTSPEGLAAATGDPEVGNSISLTFMASGIATLLALLTGLPLAYLLARYHFKGKRLVESVIDLPLVIPHTAAGIALLMVFGRQGVLGPWLAALGLTFTDSLAGIVVAMAFVSLPYLVDFSREAIRLIDPEMERVALIDGATQWQAFWHVTLPLAWRGVVSGMLMMWARGISEFGAVVILAYHPKVVTVLLYERFEGFGLNAGLPVAAILIVVALVAFILLRLVLLPARDE